MSQTPLQKKKQKKKEEKKKRKLKLLEEKERKLKQQYVDFRAAVLPFFKQLKRDVK